MELIARIKADIVLFGALAANLGIAVAKFVAAGMTGSSSMLTEGVHSLVDSGNQVLLLWGQRRAARPPDRLHPFGYARELYFWAFVVAMLIFALGAGVSILEGIAHIRAPEPMRDPTVNYIVIAVATLLEGTSWTIAVREFGRPRGMGWWRAIRRSKDPAKFIVLFEDSAALIGLALAALGVWASHWFDAPWLDGAASIAIGTVLAVVAVLLAREAKDLLIGESADPALIETVRATIAARPEVIGVNHVRTVQTGPATVFAAVSADFCHDLSMGAAERLLETLEDELKAKLPQLASLYIRPECGPDPAADA